MRVVVTGAGGLIGSEVVRSLAASGHLPIAVDRAPGLLAGVAGEPDVAVTLLDLADAPAVQALFRRETPDALIHLAWYAHPKDYLTSHANLAALAMTNVVVEAALAAGCPKLVLGGSCVEYAPSNRPLRETDPVGLHSLYATAKHAAHQVASCLAAESGAALAWTRIFHIHGPHEHPDRLIPFVARQIRAGNEVPLTDGTQVRDQLHIADVAAALIAIATTPGATGTFNVCSGQPVTLKQVLTEVADILDGVRLLKFGALPHRPNETMYLAGDSSRLRALGWAPRFDLRGGLADALRGKI
jgi:nucleoside-diphosphate-sugar epimerase